MSSAGKVSIIIPVFNAAKTVEHSLLSSVNQTYANKEIIVVDGQSTDGSLEIIKRYSDSLVHLISEKDSGVYSAINKGIALSTGDWIYILGADDYFSDDWVLSKMTAAVDDECMLVFGNVINEGATNRAVRNKHISALNKALYWRNTLHQQSVLYNKKLFRAFRFDENLKVLADYDFHLFLLSSEVKFKYIDLNVAHCTAHGLSKQFEWSLYKEELTIKRNRLPGQLYLLNTIWVRVKYLIKKAS